MGGLPDDVLQFIERRFAEGNRAAARAALQAPAVSTPRVMRAVLYLSNGSLSRLQHYVAESHTDVRGILTDAEYAGDPSDELIHLRDMSRPFADEDNLGGDYLKKNVVAVRHDPASALEQSGRPRPRSNYHSYLVQQSFTLGEATYLVRRAQTHPDRVSCYRKSGTVVRIVVLPLFFVLDQLAERIELDATNL